MLLGDDISVVEGLDARLDAECEAYLAILAHVLNADLVVATVEGCEVVTHFFVVEDSLNFLSLWVRNRQHQRPAGRLDEHDSCKQTPV